jgi:hypothetical protein
MKQLAESRVTQLKEHTSYANAGVYDPAGVGGTHVMYVLHDARNPEHYGGLPSNPTIPLFVKLWKGPLKWVGGFGMALGIVGVFFHHLRYGSKEIDKEEEKRP